MSSSQFPLLFVLIFLGFSQGYDCPPQRGAYALCGTTVVYILDTSVDLSAVDIATEFDWIRSHILPGTAWGTSQKLALMSYGTGYANSQQPTTNLALACEELDTLQNNYNQLGSKNASLLKTMQAVEVFYGDDIDNMVLFSASKNLDDIASTGNYIRSQMSTKHITVIALNGSDFTGFPASVIYYIPDLANSPPNLPACIIKQACSQGSSCDINGITDATVSIPPPTAAPTTISVSTTGENTDWQTTTTRIAGTTAPPAQAPQCQCNVSTVWVDMIFLMDASSASTEHGLDEMWDTAGTMLDFFTVSTTGFRGTNYTSRVGIITYGNAATVIKSLGSVDNDGLDDITSLPYNGDANTNLEAGLQAAVKQFESAAHRSNAVQVIIIMASTYNSGGVNAPKQAADTFKANGGKIIVYNYVQEHGDEAPTLEDIASPGYFLSTKRQNTYQDLELAICDANCFCPPNYQSYTNSLRGSPSAGCYAPVETQSNYRLASNKCKMFNNGFLAFDESRDKSSFLANQFLHSGTMFLIGLVYDNVDGRWEWADGSSPGSYQPWASGSPPNGANSQTCAFVDSNLSWQATDCRNGYLYVCEAPPADSMHYYP